MNQLIIFKCVVLALNLVVLSVCAQDGHNHGHEHSHHVHHKVYHPKNINYSCPPGYEQQGHGKGSQCVKKITAPPKSYCRVGDIFGDKCKAFEPPQYSCPPGYYKDDSNSGYNHGGNSNGHGHHGGYNELSCINVMQVPFEKTCPQGSEATKDGCIRTETSPIWMVCPIGRGGSEGHSHDHSNRDDSGGHSHGSRSSTECIEYKIVPPLYSCRQGYTLVGETCHGAKSRPCPQNYDSQENHHHHSHGDDDGDSGHDHGHDHHRYNNIPSKVKMCDVPVQVPATRICPPEAVETSRRNRHGNHGHHHYGEQTCVIPVQVPLQPYCPLSGGFIDVNQQTCSTQVRDNLISRCPAGFAPCSRGGGHSHGSGNHNHGHDISTSCCKISFEKPIATCSKGYTFEHSKCLAYYPLERVCENGFVLKDEECESYDIRQPINAPVAQVLRKESAPIQKK